MVFTALRVELQTVPLNIYTVKIFNRLNNGLRVAAFDVAYSHVF